MGPWVLLGFDEIGASSWSLAQARTRDLGFPRRVPRDTKASVGEPFWTDCGCVAQDAIVEYAQGPAPLGSYSYDQSSSTGPTGTVLLIACVNKGGRVCWIRVADGIPGLSERAADYVRTWRFRPARLKDGSPAAVWMQLPITYH